MRKRLIDFGASVLSAVISAGVIAGISALTPTDEEFIEREVARIEGVYATAPEPSPIVVAPPEVEPDDEPIEDLTRADVERLWKLEMDAADATDEELATLWAKTDTESRFNHLAVSPVGALGAPQFMPRTGAEEFKKTEPSCDGVSLHDVPCSARAQIGYSRTLESWLPPDARTPELVQASYNWGIGRVRIAIANCHNIPGCNPTVWDTIKPLMPGETKAYVDRISRVTQMFKDREVQVSFAW